VDGLELIMKALLSTKPWLHDPDIVPMPWRPEIVEDTLKRANSDGSVAASARPLKIGIHWTDGIVDPHPPIARGLKIVNQVLQNAGHKVGLKSLETKLTMLRHLLGIRQITVLARSCT
jgi:amidase